MQTADRSRDGATDWNYVQFKYNNFRNLRIHLKVKKETHEIGWAKTIPYKQ